MQNSTIGLRATKKRQTRQELALAAQALVFANGLDAVTVDQIAAAAGVSPRTFFNYFSCKEEAIVGIDPDAVADLADDLRARPPAESPPQALRAVLLADVDAEGMAERWRARIELVRRHPALLPHYLAGMVEMEGGLAIALAERMGVDSNDDPSPQALSAAVMAIIRTTLRWCSEHDATDLSVRAALDRALNQVFAKGASR